MNENVTEVEARLMSHEAVCAERYEQIKTRLTRLETILIGCAGAIISAILFDYFIA
jgi:hypothetical protein